MVLGPSWQLGELDGTYLQFTNKKGVLRCIKSEEDWLESQGLYFLCPKCKGTDKQHALTMLFDLPSVPVESKPQGRWVWNVEPLTYCSLDKPFRSPTDCGFAGHLDQGEVFCW